MNNNEFLYLSSTNGSNDVVWAGNDGIELDNNAESNLAGTDDQTLAGQR